MKLELERIFSFLVNSSFHFWKFISITVDSSAATYCSLFFGTRALGAAARAEEEPVYFSWGVRRGEIV